jgi:F420-dependent oxidoreductase-like protein
VLAFKTPAHRTDWAALRAIWRAADQLPVFGAGWAFDHLYPWRADAAEACLEGWTLLAALAAETHRLRLGLMVTSHWYRHPALLAKMAATVDHISGGRLELGVGAGGDPAEARAFGVPLPDVAERIERLEEGCQVVRRLLTGQRVSFAGRYYRLEDAVCAPAPLQQPVPLTIGGRGPRLLRVVARWADVWNFPGGSADQLGRTLATLRATCAEVGRDPREVAVSAQLPVGGRAEAVAATAADLLAAGAEHLVFVLEPPFDLRQLERAARAAELLG